MPLHIYYYLTSENQNSSSPVSSMGHTIMTNALSLDELQRWKELASYAQDKLSMAFYSHLHWKHMSPVLPSSYEIYIYIYLTVLQECTSILTTKTFFQHIYIKTQCKYGTLSFFILTERKIPLRVQCICIYYSTKYFWVYFGKIKYLNKLSNEVPTFLILHAYKVVQQTRRLYCI